jgi:hypothetical protein
MSLPTYPSNVIAALMRNTAREAVKYNIRAEGLRVTDFLPKDISRMAEAFVDNHRDKLLAGARFALLSAVRSYGGCLRRSSGNGRSGLQRRRRLSPKAKYLQERKN